MSVSLPSSWDKFFTKNVLVFGLLKGSVEVLGRVPPVCLGPSLVPCVSDDDEGDAVGAGTDSDSLFSSPTSVVRRQGVVRLVGTGYLALVVRPHLSSMLSVAPSCYRLGTGVRPTFVESLVLGVLKKLEPF